MGNADGCGSFDFSYNGLGDEEAIIFAKVLTSHFKISVLMTNRVLVLPLQICWQNWHNMNDVAVMFPLYVLKPNLIVSV